MKKLIGIYIAVGILTFGHAWKQDYGQHNTDEVRIMAAPFCSAVWPLYWSAVLWR